MDVNVEVAEDHPFLPGYVFGKSGTLGDVWELDVEVLDADGDPAEGAIVRIYLGTKSVGTARVGFNGVAKVKLNLNKLGVQTFKIVASDDDPSSKGESIFKLKVNEPKIARVFTPVKVCDDDKCEVRLSPNPQLIMDAGCNDVERYWLGYTPAAAKKLEFYIPGLTFATWPFTTSKKRGPMSAAYEGTGEQGFTFAEMIINQAMVYTGGTGQDTRGQYTEPLGTQVLCQTDKGELIILK